MCLAVPAQVQSIDDNSIASCKVGDSETLVTASLMLLEGQVEVGDYVIMHAGFAIRRLDPKEAEESLRILQDMARVYQDSGVFNEAPDLGGEWSADEQKND